jgi:hypothetical protein
MRLPVAILAKALLGCKEIKPVTGIAPLHSGSSHIEGRALVTITVGAYSDQKATVRRPSERPRTDDNSARLPVP